MSIILYEYDELDFTSNGIGSLSEALSCSVHEERNGEFELSMTYPIVARRYSDLQLRRIIMAKPDPYRAPQPFRIYQISKPLNGVVSVSARHISYDLIGYPTRGITIGAGTNDFQRLIQALNAEMTKPYNLPRQFEVISNIGSTTKLIKGCYYSQNGVIYHCIKTSVAELGADTDLSMYVRSYLEIVDAAVSVKPRFIFSYVGRNAYDDMHTWNTTEGTITDTVVFQGPTNMRNMLVSGSGADVASAMNDQAGHLSPKCYGSFEYEWDRWNVILHEYRGGDKGYIIRYKKNLLDFQQEESSNDLYTGIYPYTTSGDIVTVLDGNGIVYCNDVDENAIEVVPDQILVVDLTSEMPSNAPTNKTILLDRAKQYIVRNKLGQYNVSVTVSFVDLARMSNYENLDSLSSVRLCDLVHIEFPLADISIAAEVTALTYNVLTDKYEDVTLGTPRSSIVDSIAGWNTSENTVTEILPLDLVIGYTQLDENGKAKINLPRIFDLRYDSERKYLVTLSDSSITVESQTEEYFTVTGSANMYFTWEVFAAHEYHAGTLDDPIPFTGHMTLKVGFYYSEITYTYTESASGLISHPYKMSIYQCIVGSGREPYGDLTHSLLLSNCALVTFVKEISLV